MNKTLYNKLESISTDVILSQTSDSVYFNVGRIIVRLSDHFSENSKHDIAVFDNGKSTFVVIPMIGMNKEVQWFSKADDVVSFINNFEKMARIMLKPPVKTTVEKEENRSSIEEIWDSILKILSDYEVEDCKTVLDELHELAPERVHKVLNVVTNAKKQGNSVKKMLNIYLNQLKKSKKIK